MVACKKYPQLTVQSAAVHRHRLSMANQPWQKDCQQKVVYLPIFSVRVCSCGNVTNRFNDLIRLLLTFPLPTQVNPSNRGGWLWPCQSRNKFGRFIDWKMDSVWLWADRHPQHYWFAVEQHELYCLRSGRLASTKEQKHDPIGRYQLDRIINSLECVSKSITND